MLAKDAEAILAAPYGEVVTREEAVPGAKGGLTRRVVDTTVVFTHALATLQYLASAVPDAVNRSAPLNESHFSTTSLLRRSRTRPPSQLVTAVDYDRSESSRKKNGCPQNAIDEHRG